MGELTLKIISVMVGGVIGVLAANWLWNLRDKKRREPFLNPAACRKLDIIDYEVTLRDGRVFIGAGDLWYDKATGRWLDWPGWAELACHVRREKHK